MVWSAAGMIALVMLAGAVVVSVPEAGVLDRWWYGVVEDLRTSRLVGLARVLDWVGGGLIGVYVIPLLIGAVILMLAGWRSAAFAIVAFSVSALAVQAAKNLLGRARPEDLMVAADYGSFPSGHTANAATIAVVLWLVIPSRLLPRVIVAVMGMAWVLLMGASRTILAVHWATDVAAGALLGVAVALLVAVPLLPWARRHDRGLLVRRHGGSDRAPGRSDEGQPPPALEQGRGPFT